MKNFLQFISESTAVQQAKRLGLQGDGHGGWYDQNGEFVAKTEKGRLKFYNKRQRIGRQDPPQSDKEKNLSATSYEKGAEKETGGQQQAAAPEQPATQQAPVQDGPQTVEKTK